MSGDSESDYSFVEMIAMIIVLADIPIIALAVVAGPLYAVGLAVIVLLGGVGAWYLARRFESGDADEDSTGEADDPVTELQRRYAAGELTREEFETKLDRLIESNERAERAGVDTEELSFDRAE